MDNSNFFSDNFHKEMILDIKKMPKEQALDLLIKTMCQDKRILDIHSFKQSIISREMLMSTGIGNGIAIPHARLDSLEGLLIGMLRCKEGIPYESIDDKPVHFIFMIASSKDNDKGYLKFLASLTAKLKQDEMLEKLISAETTEDIYEILINP